MFDLEFANPNWIHGVWLILLFALALIYFEWQSLSRVKRILSSSMSRRLVFSSSFFSRAVGVFLFVSSLVCFLLALMRPQYGFVEKKLPQVGAQIMVCLDVSKSMLAEDTAPNRLERAKSELEVLLNYLEGDQVGLIAFAGKASVLCPLTSDFGYLKMLLREATPSSVGRGGTMLEAPIRRAIAGFSEVSDMSKVVVLITDGEDNGSKPMDAAKAAAERGIKIITIGFGDEAGTRIQITDSLSGRMDYVRDESGKPVVSRLDIKTLTGIAQTTDGAFIPARVGSLDVESIHRDHIKPLMRAESVTRRVVRNEAFQWPLLMGTVLFSLALIFKNSLSFAGHDFASWLESRSLGDPEDNERGSAGRSGKKVAVLILTPIFFLNGLFCEQAGVRASELVVGKVQDDLPSPQSNSNPADNEDTSFKNSDDGKTETSGLGGEMSSSSEPSFKIPDDPLTSYNLAVDLLKSNPEYAEKLLEASRRDAGRDGELRFRTAYNLGWVKINQADESLKDQPEDSLKHLQNAANWFREAVRLRPRNNESRQNLEIVLQRIVELADSLKKTDETELSEQLDAFVEREIQIVQRTRRLLEMQAGSEPADLNADESARQFRLLSVDQRIFNSDLQELARRLSQEVDQFNRQQAEKNQPNGPAPDQEALLDHSQKTNCLVYLNRAIQRLGQARSQMRFRHAERAARRSALGLDELKRARDQLRDPTELLQQIIADTKLLNQQTIAFQAGQNRIAAFLGNAVELPKWLSPEYLGQFQNTQFERTNELTEMIRSALASGESSAGESSADSEDVNRLATLREVQIDLQAAVDDFSQAKQHATEEKWIAVSRDQQSAIENLLRAYEKFADLRSLIELANRDHSNTELIFSESDNVPPKGKLQLVDAIQQQLQQNLNRVQRMLPLAKNQLQQLENEAGPAEDRNAAGDRSANQANSKQILQEREKLQRAMTLIPEIEQHLQNVQRKLKDAQGDEALAAGVTEQWDSSRKESLAAMEKLRELQILFFSMIERMQNAARRQQTLVDETERENQRLNEDDEDFSKEKIRRLGPLQSRQSELAATAADIGAELMELAKENEPGTQPNAGGTGQNEEPNWAEAGELVNQAKIQMDRAVDQMFQEGLQTESIRTAQQSAVARLVEAIEKLQPPDSDQNNQDNSQSQQSQEPEQGEQGDQGQDADPMNQLLQGIRDREAQRRKNQQRGQFQERVEKDW